MEKLGGIEQVKRLISQKIMNFCLTGDTSHRIFTRNSPFYGPVASGILFDLRNNEMNGVKNGY